LIILVALLAGWRSLPSPLVVLVLGVGGGYLLVMAWKASGIGRRSQPGGRVTYWRGQRIEIPAAARRSRSVGWGNLGSTIVYALIGLALLVGAALIVINQSGF